MTTVTQARKQRPRFRDLFFIRRRPRLTGITPDIDLTGGALDKLIESDSFVTPKDRERYEIDRYPVIVQDLRDLERYLLPTFFEFSQKAKYYQNQFYLYQWVFILGAFLTTLFGTLTTFSYPAGLQGAVTAPAVVVEPVTPPADAAGGAPADAQANWPRIFGYMTAIIGAVTAFVTALSNRGEPQKRWAKNRRLTEELRMHYFKYLAHLAPYDRPDRVQRLRENVINTRIKEQENV